jgi:hypothetical protein
VHEIFFSLHSQWAAHTVGLQHLPWTDNYTKKTASSFGCLNKFNAWNAESIF